MATLSSRHKEKIVKDLACMYQPTEIVERVKEEFGVEISRQQVMHYHPERATNKGQLASQWERLYFRTKEEFTKMAVEIPIARKSFRLRELNDNYYRLKRMGNIPAANQVLEQAAKEMGGAFEAMKDFPPGGATQNNFYIDLKQKIIQQNNKNA